MGVGQDVKVAAIGVVAGATAVVGWLAIQDAPSGATAPRAAVGYTRSESTFNDPAEGWALPGAGWRTSVVLVSSERCGDEIRGSGVIVDGRVLTNHHVVDGAERVTVTDHDGVSRTVERVRVSRRLDVAELSFAAPLRGGMNVAPDRVTDGSVVTTAGFPTGTRYRERVATVAGRLAGRGSPDPDQAVHLSADVVPGESGSAVVDGTGRLAGLIYARATVDGNGLALDVSDLDAARAELVALPAARC